MRQDDREAVRDNSPQRPLSRTRFAGSGAPRRSCGDLHQTTPSCVGARIAITTLMAAVMCFVFLFGLAASLLLYKLFFAGSIVGAFAGAIFVALAVGVFISMYRQARRWEAEAGPDH
jgi:hypothetical protein